MQRIPSLITWIVLTIGIALWCVPATAQEKKSQPRVVPTIRGAPEWLAKYKFPKNDFVFVRIEHSSEVGTRRGLWATDYPDADLNFSAQLRQLTSLNVDEKGRIMKLTDPELSKYPFIYLSEPGAMFLSDQEVVGLRKYLLGGGFLMVDDFWGEKEWQQFQSQIKRVFPDRELTELAQEHKLFHCVFDLKEKPQVVSIHAALVGQTTERLDGREVHYKAIHDDQGRMLAVICHNTDLADGWERVDVDENYFREYSEKRAFPMGINIVFFALTQGTK